MTAKNKYRLFSWYLTKYVSIEILFGFLIGTSIFLLIMLMFQAIRLSDFVVVHQVSIADVGRLSLNLMLSFLPIAVPVAFLFSVLMGISRANSEGEILALQANGISLYQVFLPIGIFSFFVSLVCLYTALYTVPQGNRQFELLITKLSSERVMSQLKPGVFAYGFYGMVLFAENVTPIKNEMKRVFIYDDREGDHPLSISASGGIFRSNESKGILTLRLTDGTIYLDPQEKTEVIQKIDFDVYDINLDVPSRGDVWRGYSPPSYNYDQLKTRLVETIPDPPAHRRLTVELHRRFSLSFSCIVFALLGFAIGIKSQRGVRSTSVIICLLVGVVYWLSYLAANALAVGGAVAPWFGVWAPNFLFALLAGWFYFRYGKA